MNAFTLVGKIQNIQQNNGMAYVTIMTHGVKQNDFIDCVCFGTTADFLTRYFTKGKWCTAQGRISKTKYNNEWRQELVISRLGFCGEREQPTYQPPANVDYRYVGGKPDDAGNDTFPEQSFTEITAEEEQELPF